MQQEKQRNPQRQLVWNNVSYILNKGVPATEKYILNKVSGTATGGEVIAIMGPSGAGKSSLLNCLSGRISVGEIGGHITLNGQPRDLKTWKKQVSFVEQDDIMFSFLSVKETILTAAKLRLNSSKFSKEEKERKADDIIRSLRLSSVSNTMIGSAAVRGVSGGERKRVAIGVELVKNNA